MGRSIDLQDPRFGAFLAPSCTRPTSRGTAVPASCSDNNPEDDWRPNDASQRKHLHSQLTGVVRARIEEPVPRATLTGRDWMLLHPMHKTPRGPYSVTHALVGFAASSLPCHQRLTGRREGQDYSEAKVRGL